MYESEQSWRAVDDYFVDRLVVEDAALVDARRSAAAAGLPTHEVAANQGQLLAILCRMIGARRVLEIGTLAGYSTIWFARAVGTDGLVTSLEVDPVAADVARSNLRAADVADRVDVVLGPARDSLVRIVEAAPEPYDVVFIDADKGNNPHYLAAALELIRVGGIIVADNVVRNGEVVDEASQDERVVGTRALIDAMGSDPRLSATALQTVGLKGWDGLALALVVA
ncbi:MAG: O-methyltransferase [Aeromicrobium erythreum]